MPAGTQEVLGGGHQKLGKEAAEVAVVLAGW